MLERGGEDQEPSLALVETPQHLAQSGAESCPFGGTQVTFVYEEDGGGLNEPKRALLRVGGGIPRSGGRPHDWCEGSKRDDLPAHAVLEKLEVGTGELRDRAIVLVDDHQVYENAAGHSWEGRNRRPWLLRRGRPRGQTESDRGCSGDDQAPVSLCCHTAIHATSNSTFRLSACGEGGSAYHSAGWGAA